MAAVDARDAVVASVGYFSVVKKEKVDGTAEDFNGCVVVFNYGLIWRVCASHHKRQVWNMVKEHVMQRCVWQHGADVVEMRRNQRREIIVLALVKQNDWALIRS